MVHIGLMRALLCFTALLASSPETGGTAPMHVVRTVTSPDSRWRVEWVAAADNPACAGMRFFQDGKPIPRQTRFTDSCSEIAAPFSPAGTHAVFQLGVQGPIHVVPAS